MFEKLKFLLVNKYKSKIAVILILTAIFFEAYWLFGIFFLLWILIDIKNKQTYLFEEVKISENIILFWIIMLLWSFFAFYYLSTLF